MKKNTPVTIIIKSFLIAIITLLVLAILGAIILMTTVNPNKYKPLIITQMQHRTGRQIRIDGDIKWRFIPFFGLEAKKIVIENPKTLVLQKQFLSIGSVALVIKLMPLLHKQVIISKLTVADIDLNLIKSGQLNNWGLTMPAQLPIAAGTSPAPTPEQQQKALPSPNIPATGTLNNDSNINVELQQFVVKNASISYTDLVTNKSYKLNDIDFNVNTGSAGIIAYKNDSLRLKNFDFRINKTLQGIGSIKFNNLSQHLNFSGSIKILPFSLNKLLKEAGLPKLAFPNHKLLENVSFEAGISGDGNSLKLKDIKLYLDSIQITGNIAVNSFTPCSVYDKLNINTFNLADIKTLNGFGLIMQNTNIEGDARSNSLADITDLTKVVLNQNMQTTNVRLLGFSVNKFIKFFNSSFNIKLNNLKDVQNALQTLPINNIKKTLEQFTSSGPKDSSQQTDLGTLQVRLALNHGILTTPLFLLSGPLETLNGSGNIDFNRKDINYLINAHLKSPSKNMMIDQMIFPLQLRGPLSNIQTNLNWDSIMKQIIRYQETSANKDLKSVIIHNAEQIKQGASNLFQRLFK